MSKQKEKRTKDWKIELPKDFKVNRNEYEIVGKKFVRVTRSLSVIAKPGLLTWFQNVGRKKADSIIKNRQVLGTKAHKLFEEILKGNEVTTSLYNQEVQMDVRLFDNFVDTCIIDWESLEQRIWSDEFAYAGTADFFGHYKSNVEWLVLENHKPAKPKFPKGAFVCGDWKTGRDIYPEYWLQMAAYVNAFREQTGIKLAGAFIAQFRNGKIRVKEMTYDELMRIFEVYKSVLNVYRWKYYKSW